LSSASKTTILYTWGYYSSGAGYRKPVTKPRVVFNPSNPEHMLDFATFVKYNTWVGGCQYYLEDPHLDIPTMIRAKIAEKTLSRFIEKV
jgi:hypothetical protein